MHADVSAARLDVALEDILLRRIQHVPRRTQEDDGAVARQVLLRKSAGVLSRVDRKPMLLSELAYGGDAVGSGVVTESGGLGKDEHVRLLRRCGDRGGDRDRGKDGEREGNEESVHGHQSAAAPQPAPIRSANFSRSMLPPETMATIGP